MPKENVVAGVQNAPHRSLFHALGLTEEEQKNLLETIQSEDCTPSLSQAQKMKQLSQLHRLDMDMIFKIMTTAKPNQKEFLKLPLK